MSARGDARRTIAAIGPCIAVASYEVGAEFEAAFLETEPASRRFFQGMAAGRRHFDLAGFCADRLAQAGVGTVERLDRDTCAEAANYFSYRRATLNGERHFGLQVAAITRS
ncbi:MAG: laccase domain-containing protein [Geminicoccaceae bacterium]